MEKRYNVSKNEVARIQDILKKQGYSIRDINSEIDAEFKNYLYKGHSMSQEVFESLKELADCEIRFEEANYSNGKMEPDAFPDLEKCNELAELIGIILGDGHIRERSENRGDRHVSQYYLQFTFHEDEVELIDKTINLCEELFGYSPKKYSQKGKKAVHLKLYSKELIQELKDLGLETGNKVENQIIIPEWIFYSKEYEKRCLCGLIDTDGCVYKQRSDGRSIVKFSNRSKNLLVGFRKICLDLGYTPSSAGQWEVQLAHQGDVENLLNEIQPLKGKEIQSKISKTC